MNNETGLRQFERLAAAIGAAAALRLCAYCGPRGTLYVPTGLNPATSNNATANVIGQEAFVRLIESFGGKTISIPSLEFVDALRAAGQVACLSSYSVPTRVIASCVGRGIRRVEGIRKNLQENGPIESKEGE